MSLLPTLALAGARWNAGPGIGAEDYAQYILHARALVEGRPYRDTGYLFTRLNPGHGPSALPPGVPLVLAAVFKVAGESAAAIKVTMLMLSLAFFLVAGLYFARHGDPWLGPGVTALMGLSPWVVAYSTLAQSDLPFMLFVWCTLLLADRDGAWSVGRALLVTVSGFTAMAFRPVAALLVPAMFVVALVRRRELRWRGVIPPLIWCGAFAAAAVVFGLPAPVRSFGWLREVGAIIADHQVLYRLTLLDALTRPLPGFPLRVYQISGVVFAIVGVVWWLRTAWRTLAAAFAVVYGSALLVLPIAAPRYVWALFPVALYCFLRGLQLLVQRLAPARNAGAMVAAAALVIAVASAVQIALSPPLGSFATHPAALRLFAEMRRLNGERPLRVAFSRPRIMALEAGIPAMPLLMRSGREIEAELDRQCITDVIIGSLGLRTHHDSAMTDLVRSRPTEFAPEYVTSEFSAYRFTALHSDRCPPTIGAPTARKLPQ